LIKWFHILTKKGALVKSHGVITRTIFSIFCLITALKLTEDLGVIAKGLTRRWDWNI